MKITILAYYFHPDQNIAAVRPENWATWLSEDHDVTVVTRECTDASEKAFPFQVLRPKSYGIRFLEWAKGCRDRLRSSKGTVKNIERKSQIQFGPQKISGAFHARMPSIHDLWFSACYSALKTTKPDIVIASYGPYVSVLAAYFYTMNHPTAKLWLDYRDFWTANYITIGVPFLQKIEEYLENRCMHSASIISSIGEIYSNQLSQTANKKCYCIYNSPLKKEHKNKQKAVNNKITICYTGTIYSGWRDPSPLFSLIKNWSKENIISADTFSLSIASKYPGNIHEILT
ncbi:MAG: hypothetical protein EOM23_11300, partial [Candidatus Moranbacteria bacterium]|nr:hypothetical protein [Candidatus Moranbacteria bacterium]